MNNFIKDIKLIMVNKKILGIIFTIMFMVCALVCTHHKIEKEEKNEKFIVGIVNEENNSYADLLIDFFKTNESFKQLAVVVEGKKDHIEGEFKAGNINAYIVIPKGFVEALMYLEKLDIDVYIDGASEAEAIILKSILQSYERYVVAVQYNSSGLYDISKSSGLDNKLNHKQNVIVSMNLIKKAMNKESFFKYNELDTDSLSIVNHYLLVLLYAVIVYMGIYSGVIVKREQLSGVLKLYKVNGGSMGRYIISKAFCVAILLSAMVSVPVILSIITKDIYISPVVIIMVGIISFIINALMIGCSLLISSINIYTLLFNVLALITLIVGGGIIPLAYMPDNMVEISKAMPFYIFSSIMKGFLV